MMEWKLKVVNKTGSKANVMVFQTMPNDPIEDSYCTAWRVVETSDPGNFDLELPYAVKFYVIERFNGVERNTGPFEVSYGQVVNVSQTSAEEPPIVTIKSDESVPKHQINVNNMSDNAQKLEMALFKNGSKIVFYKDVRPGQRVSMSIKPTVCMSVVDGVTQGEEFQTDSIFVGDKMTFVMSEIAQFKLSQDNPVMKIEIIQKSSGEYVFTEM